MILQNVLYYVVVNMIFVVHLIQHVFEVFVKVINAVLIAVLTVGVEQKQNVKNKIKEIQ